MEAVAPPDRQPAESSERSAAAPVISMAANTLAAAGVASPRADAELLAAHVLGVPRGRVALMDFTAPQLTAYRALVAERARRVPLQHLTGTAPFRYLELAVGPGVFVPRPETELLVSWGLSVIRPGAVVVDLCAGSGAIALAVANEAPTTTVYAVERSPEAGAWLRRNAADRAAAGDPPITVIDGDVADPDLLADLDGRVDLVLSNPPYVPAGSPVAPEVAEHDPPVAVFGGPDGLAVVRAVVACAARLLAPGGHVGIEHDDSQGESVPALLAAQGTFRDIQDHRDLAGRPRYTTGRMAD